jgi:hypothetical protein
VSLFRIKEGNSYPNANILEITPGKTNDSNIEEAIKIIPQQ